MPILPVFVNMEKENCSQYDTDIVSSDNADDERESFDGWLVDGK